MRSRKSGNLRLPTKQAKCPELGYGRRRYDERGFAAMATTDRACSRRGTRAVPWAGHGAGKWDYWPEAERLMFCPELRKTPFELAAPSSTAPKVPHQRSF